MKRLFVVWFVVVSSLARVAPAAAQLPANAKMPAIVGEWWQITGMPELGGCSSPDQRAVDFAVWQAADGTWHLRSCIRRTAWPDNTRLLYGWEGVNLTDANWRPAGIKLTAQPDYGEIEGGMQAPHVVVHEGGTSDDGFTDLFNGKDLAGWVLVNTDSSTWTVQDGILICSGKPYGEIRTELMYQNFVLEVEWRHMVPKGNGGIFIWADDITARGEPFHRSIEVQVLDNAYGNTEAHTTHGDIFPIHGATMTPVNGRGGDRAFPTEHLSKPSPEWNHYRITGIDGEITLAVNGTTVTQGRDSSPRKGYICLESEGGVVHYRNLRIKELADSPIDPADVATADRGFRSLYNGLDLSGWTLDEEHDHRWSSTDWILSHEGASFEETGALSTEETFGDFGFVVDVRRTAESGNAVLRLRGSAVTLDLRDPSIAAHVAPPGSWSRFEGELTGNRLTLIVNGVEVAREQPPDNVPTTGPISLLAESAVEFANIYVRELDELDSASGQPR
jgi:hypothetical protein